MRKLALFAAAAALLASVPLALPASAATPQERRLRQPVFGSFLHGDQYRNFADPSILRVGDTWYAYSTHQTGQFARRIMVINSTDLYNWNAPAVAANEALASTPAWARGLSEGGAFWAPSVIAAGGRYVMYFSARHRSVSSSRPGWCIGVATAQNPEGPFQPNSSPLFCRVNSSSTTPASLTRSPATDRGAIDPQVFRGPNGRLYLHFKALDNLYQLWGVRLSSTGTSTFGSARGMTPIDSQASTWEYSRRLGFTVLENPAMVYNPTRGARRRYVLLYAGGEWQQPSNYGTGYALCTSPLGGCVRMTKGRPWLRTRGRSAGPGGASTFAGPGGKPWVAYHTYRAGHVMDGWGRRLHVEPLRFTRTGPHLANRKPRGRIAGASPGPGLVQLAGRAADPDTGNTVSLTVREGGNVIGRDTTNGAGNWEVGPFAATPGQHRYCARARDDNGLAPRTIGCVNVTVQQ